MFSPSKLLNWRSVRRRPAVIVAGALLAVILFGAAAMALLIQAAGVETYVRRHVLPAWSQNVGRTITIRALQPRLFPRPRVQMTELVVAGLPGEPPLVVVESGTANLGLWSLVWSLGRHVRITRLTLEQPILNLVYAEGEGWTARDVAHSLRTVPIDVAVSLVTVNGGKVALYDRARDGTFTPPVTALDGIDATVTHDNDTSSVAVKATLASAVPNVDLRMTLTAQAPVQGHVVAKGMELRRLRGALPGRLGDVLASGLVSFDGDISEDDNGRYAVHGTSSIDQLWLGRQPASVRMSVLATIDRGNLEDFVVTANQIAIDGPAVRLLGDARIEANPLKARLDLAGPVLDLDSLLSAEPIGQGAPEILPAHARDALAAASVTTTLHIDKIVAGEVTLTDFRATGNLVRGVLTWSECVARAYGGEVVFSETTIGLTADNRDWKLRALVKGVDVGAAMTEVAHARPIDAQLSAKVTLDGRGPDWAELQKTMDGRIEATLSQAVLNLDVGGLVAQALRSALADTGLGGLVPELGLGRRTRVGQVNLTLAVTHGWMQLEHPVRIQAAFGSVLLHGRIALDGRLNLKGTLKLAPEIVPRVGARPPARGPEIPFEVAGTLADPEVRLAITPAELLRPWLGGTSPRARGR